MSAYQYQYLISRHSLPMGFGRVHKKFNTSLGLLPRMESVIFGGRVLREACSYGSGSVQRCTVGVFQCRQCGLGRNVQCTRLQGHGGPLRSHALPCCHQLRLCRRAYGGVPPAYWRRWPGAHCMMKSCPALECLPARSQVRLSAT